MTQTGAQVVLPSIATMLSQLSNATTRRYEPVQEIRTSIYGQILLCKDTHTKELVVVKTVELPRALKQLSRANERVQENILKEVDVLALIESWGGHANIIKLREYYIVDQGAMLHVVMDYCEGGDMLESCMDTPKDDDQTNDLAHAYQVDETLVRKYLRDVVSGLQYLHQRGIAHRDLSLENILIRHGQAVISDFGLCAQQTTSDFYCDETVGKHYYMAPEVVSQLVYDPRPSDIWSLGISFFIVLTSSPPFEIARESDPGFRFVCKNGARAVLNVWGLSDAFSEEMQDLIDRMIVVNPSHRISIEEMWHHPAMQA